MSWVLGNSEKEDSNGFISLRWRLPKVLSLRHPRNTTLKRNIGRFELSPDSFGVLALLLLCIYQLEDIVENEVTASAVWKQLKYLSIIHWSLLFVNLGSSACQPLHPASANSRPSWVWDFEIGAFHTSKAPVTATSIPPVSFEGCASKVESWCRILENGSDCTSHQIWKWWTERQTHHKFVDDPSHSLDSRRLERQHRCLALRLGSQFIISSFLASYPRTYKAAKFCRLSSNVL